MPGMHTTGCEMRSVRIEGGIFENDNERDAGAWKVP
jgi:hypothetical protein